VLEAPLAALTARWGPLPPREDEEARLVDEVKRALAGGHTPVLKVDALGAAGEAAALLVGAGLPVRAHRRIAAHLAVYERLGVAVGAAVPQWRAVAGMGTGRGTGTGGGAVILWPWEAEKLPEVEGRRVFVVDGAVVNRELARDYDGAFAISDQADLPSLVEFAAATGARDVFFTAGFDEAVERAFAARGMRAQPLVPPSQMALPRL
jgi:putative mRNA 3-end processing factor